MASSLDEELRRLRELKRLGDVRGLRQALESPLQVPHGQVSVRQRAARYLGELRAAEAVGPLSDLLRDTSEQARISAAAALGQIGDRAAVPALIRVLDDSVSLVREWAIMALGEIGDRSVISQLLPLLRHRHRFVRSAAIYALTLIDEPESRRAASEQFRREGHHRRWVIRRNLRKYARRRGLEVTPTP